MNFHTISPVRFAAQRPAKRASSPAANVYKATAPKDSVRFGNTPTHQYKRDVASPDEITIISPSGEKKYTIGIHNPMHLNAEYPELMYNLFHNGQYVGSIFEEGDGSGWTAYSINEDPDYFRYNLERANEGMDSGDKVRDWFGRI